MSYKKFSGNFNKSDENFLWQIPCNYLKTKNIEHEN